MLLADFGATSSRGNSVHGRAAGHGQGRPPPWWEVYGRNKRYITLNLKEPQGRECCSA